jgi:hypothetical protein
VTGLTRGALGGAECWWGIAIAGWSTGWNLGIAPDRPHR